jgi:hypothetical protein
MREKIAVTPSARSVQTKKKPLHLAIPLLHVDDGDERPKERRDEDDDVPRSPFGEHQRSVQPDERRPSAAARDQHSS